MTTHKPDPWLMTTFAAITILFCGSCLMSTEREIAEAHRQVAKAEAEHARMLVERRNTIEILTSIKKQVENNRDRLAQTRALLVKLVTP
jgi:hypothetical protein